MSKRVTLYRFARPADEPRGAWSIWPEKGRREPIWEVRTFISEDEVARVLRKLARFRYLHNQFTGPGGALNVNGDWLHISDLREAASNLNISLDPKEPR